jgi:hypothetical protein
VLVLPEAPADSTRIPRGWKAAVRPTEDPLRFEVIPLRVGVVGVVLPDADTLRWSVPTEIEGDSLPAPRGLASVGILKPNWWPTILLLSAILLPILFLVLRRLRRTPKSESAFPFVAEAPHLVALRRLEEIEAAGYVEAGRHDRFFVEASHVLRSYVAGRYRVPALDWTSEELKRRLIQAGYSADAIAEALPLLTMADEVKFAGHRPSAHQAEQWLEDARRYVHATHVEAVYTTQESVTASAQLQGEGA